MENEENSNWLEIYMDIQEGKDIKNSPAFKLLNSNNIDTNELTRHEKDKDAGVVELNYKDEKEKETDSISFSQGLLAFVADMPEETVKALMMAFLNGTDVAANAAGVVFNAMTNSDPAVALAFQEGNPEKFKKLVNANIQEFSKYLNEQKKEVKEIGEGSELNSKAAQFVSMVTQDTPYSLPIYKKLTSLAPLCKSHKKFGFIEPIKYYVPSIGITEIEKIPQIFNKDFDNDFFIASMGTILEEGDLSIHHIKLDSDLKKILKEDLIVIGERIRDLKYIEDMNIIILFMENSPGIGILSL